jgi:adenylate kinase
MLAAGYRIPHISTGDMFRDHKARGTELGKQIQAIMDSGGLVTDEVTNALVKDRLSRPDVAPGFILDGYPRTTAQAEYLESLLRTLGRSIDRVISYEVPEEAVVERISGRRSCPKCGAVYHVTASPPRTAGVCDREGAALVLRDDDRPENVKKRMQEYADKTWPLKRFYRERKLVAEVEATGAPEAILQATRSLLGAAE